MSFWEKGIEYEEVYGVKIRLPQRPPKAEIINYGLPPEEQVFRQTPIPDIMSQVLRDHYGRAIWSKAQLDFVKQEFTRRRNGCWYYINEHPTYITGHQYFELNYCKLPEGNYKEYRDTDRRTHLYIWEAMNSPNCLGVIVAKQRRRGLTTMANAINLNLVTSTKGAHTGIQSKSESDAQDVFLEMVEMFLGLPEWFQPIREGTERPKKELRFFEPSQLRSYKNQASAKSAALNSWSDYRATVPKAYDGRKLKFYHGNEFGKLDKVSVKEIWSIVKECLVLGAGSKVIGFALIESTVGEFLRGGGKEFKQLWEQSDPTQLTKNGMTVSGLRRLFLPAYDGLENFIGKYGESIIDSPTERQKIEIKETYPERPEYLESVGSREWLQNTREGFIELGDFEGLANEKRKYPLSEQDAFSAPLGSCIFDQEKIETRINQLSLMESSGELQNKIVKGNFVWAEQYQKNKVRFEPSKNGRWSFVWMPQEAEDKNKVDYKRGKLAPINQARYVIGTDPIDYTIVKETGRLSNASAYVYKKSSAMEGDVWFNDCFIGQYLHRPPLAETYFEDIIKAAIFFGCEFNPESNKKNIIQYAIDNGFEHFVMHRPVNTLPNSMYGKKQSGREPGTPSTESTKQQGAEEINSYIHWHIQKVFWLDLLYDWLAFDIKNTQVYDAAMGSIWTLIGRTKIFKERPKQPEVVEMITTFKRR